MGQRGGTQRDQGGDKGGCTEGGCKGGCTEGGSVQRGRVLQNDVCVAQHIAQHTGDLVSPCMREPSVGNNPSE